MHVREDGREMVEVRPFEFVAAPKKKAPKYTEPVPFFEAARGNVERHLGDVAEEEMSADAIYDEAYTLAFDGAVDAGATMEEAREAAQYAAQCIAQP